MARPNDVLVVDDDDDLREVIQLMLVMAGYPSRSAPNGKVALEEIAKAKPALVLLDMLMPVMNGWEFARRLREIHGDTVPFVVVSAAEHVGCIGQELGAAAVLSKPFDQRDLLLTLERSLPNRTRSPGC